MSRDAYAEREATKQRHEKYRLAAARLYPGLPQRHLVAVNENADHTCAFIEVTVCVPRSLAELENMPCECGCALTGYQGCDLALSSASSSM